MNKTNKERDCIVHCYFSMPQNNDLACAYMRMHSCKNLWKPALDLIASLVNRLVLFAVF